MKPNMLVLGGTGKTGRKVVQQLTSRGYSVRVGSRAGSPAFDWQNPQDWGPVFEGMDRVYITFQPDLAVPGAYEAIQQVVTVAKEKGVSQLVLLSGKGESEAERCEKVITQSGLAYTIVRANWFMQNFSESFFLDPILAGHVALPKAAAWVPYVHTQDIADVVVAALTDEQHQGQIYELTGPELFTFEQVITQIAEASGRNISFEPTSVEGYVNMLRAQGVPADYVWLVELLFTEVIGAPGNDIISPDVERVLGRAPISFATYVKETAPTGVWNTIPVHMA